MRLSPVCGVSTGCSTVKALFICFLPTQRFF
jgi:hypothetical protein